MLLRGEGLADEQGQGLDDDRVVYIVHTNYPVGDL